MPVPDGVVVAAGPLGDDTLAAAERALAAGGAVLLVPAPGDTAAERLGGVRVEADLPRAEWYVTLADRPESVRLDGEVPITSALRTLRPTGVGMGATDDLAVAATTSVRFAHRPVLAVRTSGRGRVVTCGVTDVEAVLSHATLGPYLRRLLRPPVAAGHALGVGVVGYGAFGGMGYAHGLACAETEGLRLVAAVDTVPERLKVAAEDFADLATYDSVDALAGDEEVDVAVVATPPVHHAALAEQLLRAGKHVVVEKPMCLSVRDADRLLSVAADVGRTLTVHQSRRWDRDFRALRRAVDAGLLGEVFVAETFVGGFEHPCRAWHSEESVSGGAVYDWGSHHVDWILLLLGGPPRRVMCTTHHRVWHDTTNADQLALWMQWDDGREATFRQSDVAAIRRPKFYVQGTGGTVAGHYRPLRDERIEPGRGHVDSWSHHAEAPVELTLVRYEGGDGLVTTQLALSPPAGWAFHRNLADHLLLGEALAVPPTESRDVVRVLEAGHRSSREGGAIVELAP